MPRDGTGAMGRTDGVRTGTTVWVQADAAGVNIEPDDHDTHDQDIAAEITNSVAVDGQSTMSGALKMGSQKITGVATGTAATDGVTLAQTQGGASNYVATDTGSADAYEISPSPAITSLVTGTGIWWIPANDNTTASTLNTSALGNVAIVTADGAALTGGEIKANRPTLTVYDGTSQVLVSVVNSLTLIDTDAGAAVGPVIALKRVSASPAAADDLGAVQFYGEDDGGNETLYAYITGQIELTTDGSEQGALQFTVADGAGGEVSRIFVTDAEVQIADSGAGATAGPALTLRRSSASPADDDLGGYISNAMNNSAAARVEYGRIQGEAADVTAATEDGAWTIQTMQGGTLTEMCRITSNMTLTRSGGPPLRVDRLTDDGTLVTFLQDSSVVGDITVSGTTVSYNGYLLTHWSQWGTGLEPGGVVPKGTLLSTVDELVVRADGEIDPNHVKVKITSDMACRRVYGVFSGVDADGHVVVDAAGAGLVRVRGPVVGGDLLMASADPGVACVQKDNLWHDFTIGKANMGYAGTDEALLPVALRSS